MFICFSILEGGKLSEVQFDKDKRLCHILSKYTAGVVSLDLLWNRPPSICYIFHIMTRPLLEYH